MRVAAGERDAEFDGANIADDNDFDDDDHNSDFGGDDGGSDYA